MKQTDELIGP